jgi:PAS domain S-box-containing protein
MERLVLLVEVQLLFTLLLVALLWSFQTRLRKQRFFWWWAWAWTLFGLHLMLGALSLRLGPAWTWLKISLVSGSVLLGMMEAPLLIFGARSLRAPSALPRRWVHAGISLTLIAGGLATWLALSWRQEPITSYILRAAPRMLILAAAFGYCAAAFLRRWRAERSWAAMITGGFCLLYGMDQGFYSLLLINRLMADLLLPLRQVLDLTLSATTLLLSLDLICNSGICLGMVLLLLEEHQHTEQALTQCHSRGREMAAEIAERVRLQEALQESEGKFRSLAETVACAIWIHDGERFLYFNTHVSEVTGYSRQQLSSMSIWELVHPEYRQMVQTRSEARRLGEDVPSRYEFKIVTRRGEERWLDFTARLTQFEGRPAILGAAFDVTQRKQLEKTLAGVSRRLIAAQEKERSWVARELHDDINQRIALLAIELERLRQQSHSADHVRDQLDALCKLTSEIGADVQRISHHLHSPKLEYLGLVAASRSLCHDMAQQHGIAINFLHHDVPDSIPGEIALCLFRVLQEALSNAVKYSGARYLEAELRGSKDGLHLKIQDSGQGFDPQSAANSQGIGLASMRERISLVGGTISIKSAPGLGTLIRAHVPMPVQPYQAEASRISA